MKTFENLLDCVLKENRNKYKRPSKLPSQVELMLSIRKPPIKQGGVHGKTKYQQHKVDRRKAKEELRNYY